LLSPKQTSDIIEKLKERFGNQQVNEFLFDKKPKSEKVYGYLKRNSITSGERLVKRIHQPEGNIT